MEILIVMSLVFSVLSLVASVCVIFYLRKAVKKEHEHIQKLFKIIWRLKDHLQAQVSAVEKKIKEHQDNQDSWEIGLRKWFQEAVAAQDLKIKIAIEKISNSLELVAKSRETMVSAFRDFVRLFHAAIVGEKKLLQASQENTSLPKPQDKPVE